jgi:hypothetical protein
MKSGTHHFPFNFPDTLPTEHQLVAVKEEGGNMLEAENERAKER